MDLLIEELEKCGLEDFIQLHKFKFCQKTVNQTQMATFLGFDDGQIAIINQPPDNFSRNRKLYEYIERTANVRNLLEALDDTGNQHVIKFVKEADFSASAQTASTLTNPNRRRGIWFNIPEPIDSFCGRADFLSQLHDQLKPRDDSETEVTVLSQVKIVSGLGGIGKTETARRYIMKQIKFYNNFIWIDAVTENSMRNSFVKLAEEIQIPVKDSEGKSREIQEILKEIYNKICIGGKSNLIVFDNAEDYLSCRQFFPFGLHPDLTKPVILATSRNQDWISPTGKIRVLPLDKMTEDESLEFMSKQLEIPDTEEFREESKEFIELIGGLPLALQQAVAYIKAEKEERKFLGNSYKINDYVQEFKLSMKKFLSFSPFPAQNSSPTVSVTWHVTFAKIHKLAKGEGVVKIVKILSFLHADKIPSTFLHDLVPEIKDREFSGALKLLEKYSLIKMNVRDFCLSIHRQIQFVILQYLKERDDLSHFVMSLVDKCRLVLKNIKLPQSGDIFLNMSQIVKNPFDLIPWNEKFFYLMDDFGSVLYRARRYSEALDLFRKIHSKRRELLGENHKETITTQNQIALQLLELGRHEEALTLFKEILEKAEIHPDLGVDHLDTINTRQNMAAVLEKQEKYGESLELLQQVLDQRNKIHGEDHPSAFETQNQIAALYADLGDLSRALALFEHVEKRQIENFGPHHPEVLTTTHNKAAVLFKMGQLEEASKIVNAVYEKRKETLGESHLDTIHTLASIASILERQGKLTEALDTYKKVFEIRKTDLGLDHPKTIATNVDMAIVLHLQKRYQESLELLQQVLEQMKKIHGENHLLTLSTQNSVSLLHFELGNFSQALTLLQDLEKRRVDILGPHHQHLFDTKHAKAIVLFATGRFQEASKIFNEVHEKRKETLGETHFRTMSTLHWINEASAIEGKFTEALELYQKTYEMRKAHFGENHPQTVALKSGVVTVEIKLKLLSL